jgi:cytochrome P450
VPILRRAGRLDTVRALTSVLIPLVAQGAVIRRPWVLSMAQRLDFEGRAGRSLRRMRDRYHGGPVLLRVPKRRVALVLEPEDVDRILARTPADFSAATPEKTAALAHFQPDAVLASPDQLRPPRRVFNETALDAGRPLHRLAGAMVTKIREEAARLLDRHRVVDWTALGETHGRLVRRIVLGDAAADDRIVTDVLDELRRDANWAWLRPRRNELRDRFTRLLAQRLQRAEPGSLAQLVATIPASASVDPYGQVPHWLFAFDAVGATVMRTLAVLAAHPRELNRARAQVAGIDLDRPRELPFLRACVLETLRLWPTTLAILRESRAPTRWRGRVMPQGTSLVVVSSYFHRDSSRLPYADEFVPDIWLDGRAEREPGIVPFSAGAARCPGEDLVLFTATTLVAALLEQHSATNVGTALKPRRLPHTLNHTKLAIALDPVRPGPRPLGRRRPAADDEPDFADEHKSATLAFEMAGGPERRRDEGSPHGLAGAD